MGSRTEETLRKAIDETLNGADMDRERLERPELYDDSGKVRIPAVIDRSEDGLSRLHVIIIVDKVDLEGLRKWVEKVFMDLIESKAKEVFRVVQAIEEEQKTVHSADAREKKDGPAVLGLPEP